MERLSATRSRIARAAEQCGRTSDTVCLVAVSKQHPSSAVRTLAVAGHRDFGESYLQEAMPKLESLKDLGLTWHFLGQIQSNKTRPIAEHFAWVHTVDRERIAQRLNEQRPTDAPPLQVCIQVKLAEEAGKGGVELRELASLAVAVRALPRLKLRGLMCIPPPSTSPTEQRAHFATLASALAELQEQGMDVDTLSMGMSDDLEAAIAAGATIVRIGTSIFGKRKR